MTFLTHPPIPDLASSPSFPLLTGPEGFTGGGGDIPARYITTHMQVELL